MRTKSEKAVLKALGISDFRHMTKDKVVEFASQLPKMDPQVAKMALEQFPSFKEFATDITIQYKAVIDKAIESNDSEFVIFSNQCNSIIEILGEELKRDDITQEDRARIEGHLIEVAQMLKDQMDKNRRFKKWALAAFGAISAIGLAALASALGSNAQVSGNALPDMDDDDLDDLDDIIDSEGDYIE